jgi:hypothetical protein
VLSLTREVSFLTHCHALLVQQVAAASAAINSLAASVWSALWSLEHQHANAAQWDAKAAQLRERHLQMREAVFALEVRPTTLAHTHTHARTQLCAICNLIVESDRALWSARWAQNLLASLSALHSTFSLFGVFFLFFSLTSSFLALPSCRYLSLPPSSPLFSPIPLFSGFSLK